MQTERDKTVLDQVNVHEQVPTTNHTLHAFGVDYKVPTPKGAPRLHPITQEEGDNTY